MDSCTVLTVPASYNDDNSINNVKKEDEQSNSFLKYFNSKNFLMFSLQHVNNVSPKI